jgi:hypothetical protein
MRLLPRSLPRPREAFSLKPFSIVPRSRIELRSHPSISRVNELENLITLNLITKLNGGQGGIASRLRILWPHRRWNALTRNIVRTAFSSLHFKG